MTATCFVLCQLGWASSDSHLFPTSCWLLQGAWGQQPSAGPDLASPVPGLCRPPADPVHRPPADPFHCPSCRLCPLSARRPRPLFPPQTPSVVPPQWCGLCHVQSSGKS